MNATQQEPEDGHETPARIILKLLAMGVACLVSAWLVVTVADFVF